MEAQEVRAAPTSAPTPRPRRRARCCYNVTNARSFALIVSTGKNNGKVKVYLNGVFLKKVKLKGPTRSARSSTSARC